MRNCVNSRGPWPKIIFVLTSGQSQKIPEILQGTYRNILLKIAGIWLMSYIYLKTIFTKVCTAIEKQNHVQDK